MPALAILATFLLLAIAPAAVCQLPEPVLSRLEAARIPPEAMGVIVRRLADGATLVAHRPEQPMQPASTLKLVTALVALETLGPAYRGATELRTAGRVQRGVLHGDLVLRGLGNVDFDWHEFERLLRLLRLQGVQEIRGDLVLDLGFFQPARTDVGLARFDQAPEFRYNVIPDALLLNSNLLQVDMASDARGLRVALTPPLSRVGIVSDMKLVDRRCEDWEDGWSLPDVVARGGGSLQIRLHGDFPRDCTASTAINVIDRVAFADRLFRMLWQGLGGRFRGVTREGPMPADARLLGEHRSRPLAELTREINKRSDNPIARVVFLTLGALAAGAPDDPSARRAEGVIREWFDRRGIDHRGLVLENGSGLSRAERITPLQLAAVLQAAAASQWALEFLASLPIVAIDGGMRRRLQDSPAAGWARVKTGTLRDVTAVAGYVKDAAGAMYIVVAMINHPLAERRVARPILDSLIDWVARSSGTSS